MHLISEALLMRRNVFLKYKKESFFLLFIMIVDAMKKILYIRILFLLTTKNLYL